MVIVITLTLQAAPPLNVHPNDCRRYVPECLPEVVKNATGAWLGGYDALLRPLQLRGRSSIAVVGGRG